MTVIEWLFIATGALLMVAGLIGALIPVIPGPLLSFLGLVALHLTLSVELSGLYFYAALVVVAGIIEYLLPLYIGKKAGATRAGIYGGILGTIIGLFFMPIGLIVGPMIGALAFESMTKRSTGESFKAALGVFLGTILNFMMRFTLCVYLAWVFVTALYSAHF